MDATWDKIHEFIMALIADLIQKIIDFIGYMLGKLTNWLPDWDLKYEPALNSSIAQKAIQTLNWVFPVDFALTLFGGFMISVVAYFTIGIFTRWIKLTN
jgi:hypothetical protein